MQLDHAWYKYDEQNLLLEIFYSVEASRLRAHLVDSASFCEAMFDLRILHNDSLWAADAWRIQVPAGKLLPNQLENRLIDARRYIAPHGRYHVELLVKDIASATSQRATDDFQLALVSPTGLQMSDLQLAAMIRQEEADKERPALYKNRLFVLPEPDRAYTSERPMLFYYFEIYNVLANVPGEIYHVKCYVTDSSGNVVNQVRGRTTKRAKSMDASVEVGSLHLGALPVGRYWLHADIVAANEQVLSRQSKSFVMLGTAGEPVVVKIPETAMQPFAQMSEAQINTAYRQAAYIMSPEQKRIYEQLSNLDAQKHFLAEFWWQRDPSPATPQNEFYLEYQRRITYANEKLRSFARAGWQTDRGRVYIVYGPPTDIEYFPSTESAKPYERWFYEDLEGGVEFIFIDKTGFREFRLVHSNKFGEIQDPNWTSQLFQ
ncbi:MAG: GWxTD domain-containing protein [candidate division KSB1 bacterium]|nr:GWxTD domain-containing protein [candidate division KSB1 bacterium]